VTSSRNLRLSLLVAIATTGMVGVAHAQSDGFSVNEKPFATISRMLMKPPTRDSLVTLAKLQVGLKYKLGAKAPGKAFDCSGLVQWILGKFDLTVPRTSREQVKEGVEIARDPLTLLPGDLLFFGRGAKISHVGIYIGDGKYVQAANRKEGVIESKLPTGKAATSWWKSVRRLFDHDSAPPAPKSTPLLLIGSSS
jgi:cell wall-associated NlpC family hydrolase